MKTRWEFRFSSTGVIFPTEHRFRGTIGDEVNTPIGAQFEVRIIPNKKNMNPGAHDGGEFHITLSGTPDDTEDMANTILFRVKEQISFPDARIDIHGGFMTATRIPENQLEAQQIGEALHDVRLAFQEFREPAQFDPNRLTNLRINNDAGILLQLFNQAKILDRPVEKYLAFFKILERAYADGRGKPLAHSLLVSDDLYEVITGLIEPSVRQQSQFDRRQYASLIRKLIRIRDNCAHLRGKTGYLPNDARIHTEVEPHLDLLISLSERVIQQRIVSN